MMFGGYKIVKVNAVLRITLVYLLFGLVWIYSSDKVIDVLVNGDIFAHSLLQTIKGFFYVSFTSVLLYFLINRYNTELQLKISKLKQSELDLLKSEEKYKLLFDASPMPVFIYDHTTRSILDVNDSAVEYYGYSKKEFENMNLAQIEQIEDISLLEEKLQIPKSKKLAHANGIFKHKKKNGEFIYVYIQGSNILYKGKPTQIIMANDITLQLQYISTVEKQNETLNKIGWLQSHVVRAPLASLMGLTHLMKDATLNKEEQDEVCEKILTTSNELDCIIREISDHTDITKHTSGSY